MKGAHPLVIVGNGIAGTTLARQYRKKSKNPIVIVSEEHPYFFSRTALMYVYMGHMKFEHTQAYEPHFWAENEIELIQARVSHFDPEEHKIFLDNGNAIRYANLVWAVGSRPNHLGWPGQDARRVQGLYHKQDLEQLEAWTPEIDKAVIVGGGLIGIELAEMLMSRKKKVTFLVRESSFWNGVLPAEEAAMLDQHILTHGVDLRLSTELDRIETDTDGNAIAVVTTEGERIDCQYVGLTTGVRPNIDFLKESALECKRGILVNRYLETNLPHVYAIGDCAEQQEPLPSRKPIEAVWYTGRIMGETLAQTLTGIKTAYQPGIWFNSAKFFDIEYQTYGQVRTQVDPKKEKQWYWQHPSENKLIRFAFAAENETLLGVSSLGIRLRHQIFEQWIREGKKVKEVIESLPKANFDPEFSFDSSPKIQISFNSQISS